MQLEVIGSGSYLPEERILNSHFTGRDLKIYDSEERVVETKRLTEEGIFRVTGIRERRRSIESPSDIGYEAAIKAIEDSGIEVDSLVGIILATVTEKCNFPNGASKIQEKLGARNCFAYDVANACAGFPEALAQANSRVLRMPGNYLVIAAECLTSITDYTDMNSTLFGDGAGAVVLRPSEERGIVAEFSKSNPFDGKSSWIFRSRNGHLRMPEGNKVLREAVREMVESARFLKEKLEWEKADVYIPHQANARIIEGVEKRVQNEGAVVYNNIEKYGNMSAATCAVALDEARKDETIKQGKRVIITSFGSGLVTSAVAMQF